MDIDSWLRKFSITLREAGIESARLDCLILLEDATGHDRAWLLAHTELELTDAQTTILNNKVAQRAKHVPLAYIRGHVEFYGHDFAVNTHVLVPRPETEAMVGLLKDYAIPAISTSTDAQLRMDEPKIIDVGTGSGVLAVTAKLEFPQAQVFGTDIDPACLEIARQNAKALSAEVGFLQADLLKPLSGNLPRADIILANLPYVPDNFQINTAASHEPALAIFGGIDGLDLYRQLFAAIAGMTHGERPAIILTEALPPHHHALASLARKYGYSLERTEGLAQAYAAL
jgi:release factor glutamine methyltransferase